MAEEKKPLVQDITEETFSELTAEGIVAVDFWADWCGPCKGYAPQVEKAAEILAEDGIKIYKMNVDENLETPAKYGVRGIPTIITFVDGEPMGVLNGGSHAADFIASSVKVYKTQ